MARVPSTVRRQQFIDAAVQVIARDGVDGATTRRIAEEANAPLATLHYCFQTKENLLWAVFEQLAELARANIEASSARGQAASEIASLLLQDNVQWAIDNPEANRAQLEIWLWAERSNVEFAMRVYNMFIDAWKGFLSTATPPLPDPELESLTRVIVALIDGFAMQFITHGDAERVLQEVRAAQGMLTAYLT
jgi:AcrR family transcriptional regulator